MTDVLGGLLADAVALAALAALLVAAILLWRRPLVRSGRRVSSAAFHRVSLTITPVSLFLGVGTLALFAR